MVATADVQFEPTLCYSVRINRLKSKVNLCCTAVYTDVQFASHGEGACASKERCVGKCVVAPC